MACRYRSTRRLFAERVDTYRARNARPPNLYTDISANVNRVRRCSALAAVCLFLVTARGLAQSLCHQGRVDQGTRRASGYLSLGHWAYPYLDLLIDRGTIRSLDPLIRPFRRIDVARAILEAERDDLTVAEREWLGLVRRELEREFIGLEEAGASAPYVSGSVGFGVRGMSDSHRDVLRPEGKGALYPFISVQAVAEFPNVAAELRFRWDDWLGNDPQFPEGDVTESHPNFLGAFDFRGRTEEGYMEVQIPFFRFMLGRINRNWGLASRSGLLVSGFPYSYDQVAYRVGADCLNLTGFVAQLDEFDGNVKRWLSTHRVSWRPRANLALSVGESVVYGGENRGFDFRLSNPMSVWLVGGYGRDYEEGPNSNNSMTELSAWWRPAGDLITYLSLLIDDFPGGGTPAQYAFTLSVQAPRLGRRLSLRLVYDQVAALTYRTVLDHQRYTTREVGLGHDITDSDRVAVQLDWYPPGGLRLSPALQLMRRGEGDLRDPWPADASEEGPVLFIGQVETTLRLSLSGSWLPERWLWMTWDVGVNHVEDVGHLEGARDTELVGKVLVQLLTQGWSRL